MVQSLKAKKILRKEQRKVKKKDKVLSQSTDFYIIFI